MPHRGDAHQGLSFFVPFAPRAPRKRANKARRAVNKRGARVGEKEEEREECAAPAPCEEDLDGEHKLTGSNVERKERAPTKHVIIELETVVQHQGFHCYISNKKFIHARTKTKPLPVRLESRRSKSYAGETAPTLEYSWLPSMKDSRCSTSKRVSARSVFNTSPILTTPRTRGQIGRLS